MPISASPDLQGKASELYPCLAEFVRHCRSYSGNQHNNVGMDRLLKAVGDEFWSFADGILRGAQIRQG